MWICVIKLKRLHSLRHGLFVFSLALAVLISYLGTAGFCLVVSRCVQGLPLETVRKMTTCDGYWFHLQLDVVQSQSSPSLVAVQSQSSPSLAPEGTRPLSSDACLTPVSDLYNLKSSALSALFIHAG